MGFSHENHGKQYCIVVADYHTEALCGVLYENLKKSQANDLQLSM